MEIHMSIIIASIVNLLILGSCTILISKLIKSIVEMKKRNKEIEILLDRVTDILDKNND